MTGSPFAPRALGLSLLVMLGCACGGEDGEPGDATSGVSLPSAGAAGAHAAGASGTAGASGASGSGGSANAGAAGASVGGKGGAGGSAGAGGNTSGGAGGGASGGAGGSASAGAGGSGSAGSAGAAGSGKGGSAGKGGSPGTGGSGGVAGSAGAAGVGSGGAAGGGAAGGGAAGGGAAGASSGLAEIVDAALFDQMFPHRDDPACNGGGFTYAAFVSAASKFPAFASQGSADDRRREVAAFLANAGHETTGGWPTAPGGAQAWGLCFREEVGCEKGACTGYCVADPKFPCASGKTYHGRGPLQLSYNYNYGQAGDALGLPLLTMPELVANDGEIAFRAALWFWMTPQAPKPSCHDVMIGAWTPSSSDAQAGRQPGFGMTVNVINGGVECSQPTPPQMADRLASYDRFTKLLGVASGANLTCDAMKSY